MIGSIVPALGAGALVGLTLGLIGGGGSILATPLLLYGVGVANPHVAIGTSAFAVSISAFLNLIGHARAGHVRWICALVFAAIGSLGALLGSTLGKMVDANHLLILFALLMIVVGVLMLRPRRDAHGVPSRTSLHLCLVTATVAIAAGAASGFFGIGGGFLVVPGLIFATGMPTIDAVGSSLLAVGSFGLATAFNYARSGLIDWPVAFEFIAGALCGGLFGLLIGTRMSRRKSLLNRVFAGLIFGVAGYMLYHSVVSRLM
jgi:uncharacterized membrane protein YfcA